MVRNKDIHPVDVILNPFASPVFHGIHRSLYHDLRSKGIMAGHRHHATSRFLSARRIATSPFATALRTVAVMRHIDLKGIEWFAIGSIGRYGSIVIHPCRSAEYQGTGITGCVKHHAFATGAVDPHPRAILIITGKHQHMTPCLPTGTGKKPQIPRKQLRLCHCRSLRILSGGACPDIHFQGGAVSPCRKSTAVQPVWANGSRGTGACRCYQLGRIPLLIPAGTAFPAPKIRHLPNQRMLDSAEG